MLANAEPRQNRLGVVGRAVGQDQLAARQPGDRRAHRRVRLERRMIDLVHVSEVIVGAHAVLGHHAAHAGAVAAVIVLLDDAGFLVRNFQISGDEFADPLVDLLPQIDVVRVERVVEIEHPGVDMMEGALCGHLGIAKRSVLPPLDISTAANPGRGEAAVADTRLCSLISNLLSRVQSWVSPPQFNGLSLNRMVRFSASTASAKLKMRLGWPVTSGCRHLPGSMRYQPRLTTVLPSSVRDGGHHLVRRVVAPGRPVGGGRLHGLDHGGEEIRRLHEVGRQSAALQECRQSGLGLWAVDAVDRRSIETCNHQQPLNAGKTRLVVIIFAVFGEISHQVAVVGAGRIYLRERRRRLPGPALTGGGDDEIIGSNAKGVAAVLRKRRSSVNTKRAGIEQDAIGRQRALQDHAARRRIDAKPSTRGGCGFVVDADRRLDHITHAVAELQVGMGWRGPGEQRDDRN